MDRTIINTPHAPAAIGPYSQALRLGNGLIYTSGQIPLDPATGKVVEGGIAAETSRVLEHLKAILESAGSGLDLVVKTTVFLADMNDFAAMNEVYARSFPTNPPARSTIQVSRLPRDVRIEIEAVALAR